MDRHQSKRLWGFVQTFKIACLILLCAAAAGCNLSPSPTFRQLGKGHPTRVVSLDYCADQFVLKLADRADIVALSVDAGRDFSYMHREAKGIPTVRATAEDVLALNPDLVVRSYGGGPRVQAFFERAGVKVHQIGWGDDFEAVRTNTREAAAALGQGARGDAVIAEFNKRLANIEPASGVTALYMTPGGITTGSGSMIDLMMTTAGLTNFQTKEGWNPLPLEHLTQNRPDMAASAFFGENRGQQEYWSAARHPVAVDILHDLPVAALDGSTTACAGWFVLDAVDVLAWQGRAVQEQKQRVVTP
jgi:iron complex transport system substrate-binding protein